MAGLSRMLVGLGHDLQVISELEKSKSLQEANIFFTDEELKYCKTKKHPLLSLGGIFAAKESLYKALPDQNDFYWTDVYISHSKNGAPKLNYSGQLKQKFIENQWISHLSISHSGEYASAVVIISK